MTRRRVAMQWVFLLGSLALVGAGAWMLHPGVGLGAVGLLLWVELNYGKRG